jgi:uncharacterized membrane protein HdeD (DUF308 family)
MELNATMTEGGPEQAHLWRWTMASGLFTLLLALVAFFLPDLQWLPRSGLVGWLLLLAGIAELLFGWKRRGDGIGKAVIGSGSLTALAGLLFVANPAAGYFPVANLVTAWLLLRGLWMLVMAFRLDISRARRWLAITGSMDVLLGLVLIAGLPVASLVVSIFGPTREIIARFALVLAASFAVTGISQIAIALAQRRDVDSG